MKGGKPSKRLQKEIAQLADPPPGIRLVGEPVPEKDGVAVILELRGAPGTLYQGETFHLKLLCDSRYPFEPPATYFVVDAARGLAPPCHEHIYCNGHICLSILGAEWTPALTMQNVALSILSMLSSAQAKKRPEGDQEYARMMPYGSDPRKSGWLYDDDKV